MARRHGFTLIELLIVVAIIAILAAIAVPNFLEAQTRSKVSRVKSDLRTLATGLEAYWVDNGRYADIARGAPSFSPPAFPLKGSPDYAVRALPLLSTPVAYLTSAILTDVFSPQVDGPGVFLGYVNMRAVEAVPDLAALGVTSSTSEQVSLYKSYGFVTMSVGPDRVDFSLNSGGDPDQGGDKVFQFLIDRNVGVGSNFIYDPTNGTISVGDISRTSKGELR